MWGSAGSTKLQPERAPFLAVGDAPDATACSEYSGDLLDILMNTGLGYAACRGNNALAVRAYLSGCDGSSGGPPTAMGSKAAWLAIPDSRRLLRLSPVVEGSDCQWLDAVLQPGLRPRAGWQDHWATVTGHFDDPAAQSCRLPPAPGDEPWYEGRAQVVRDCRSRFVVTKVEIER